MRNDGPACRDAEFLSAAVGLHPHLVQGALRARRAAANLAGVLRDIRHTEVQRTLMDAISGASPIIARYLDDAEKEAAQRMAAAPK